MGNSGSHVIEFLYEKFRSCHSAYNSLPVASYFYGLNLGCPLESSENLKTNKQTQLPGLQPSPIISELVGVGSRHQYLFKDPG